MNHIQTANRNRIGARLLASFIADAAPATLWTTEATQRHVAVSRTVPGPNQPTTTLADFWEEIAFAALGATGLAAIGISFAV